MAGRAGESATRWAEEHPEIDTAALERQAQAEQERIATDLINKLDGTERIATIRRELNETLEAGAGVFRTEQLLQASVDKVAELKERAKNVGLDDHSLSFNTELTTALELESHARRGGGGGGGGARSPRVARGAPALRPSGTGRRAVPEALAGVSHGRSPSHRAAGTWSSRTGRLPNGPMGQGHSAGRDAWSEGTNRIAGGSMSEDTKITLEVARYRPGEDERPTMQQYEVPLRDDWVVLDALNYIKDEVDGTLSYRWSCRMGVCGSCGMMVNGVPKLTCAAFLRDLAPGPSPGGGTPALPDRARAW